MYLFNQDGNLVEIYSLEPNTEKIKNYKLSKMKCDDLSKKVLCFKTNDIGINLDIETLKKCSFIKDVVIDDIVYEKRKSFDKKFHTVICMSDYSKALCAVKGYFDGNYDNSLILRVFDYKLSESEPQSYLLLNDGYVKDNKLKCVNSIINIPESLYLLELIIRQEFWALKDMDISEQLSLFKFSNIPVGILDLKTFYDSENGVIKGTANAVAKKMQEHKNFIRMIKK